MKPSYDLSYWGLFHIPTQDRMPISCYDQLGELESRKHHSAKFTFQTS